MTQTTLTGKLLVIDPITDATETATSAVVRNMETGEEVTLTDAAQIRALYEHPSAESYGEGSYTVNIVPESDGLNRCDRCHAVVPSDKAIQVLDRETDTMMQYCSPTCAEPNGPLAIVANCAGCGEPVTREDATWHTGCCYCPECEAAPAEPEDEQ